MNDAKQFRATAEWFVKEGELMKLLSARAVARVRIAQTGNRQAAEAEVSLPSVPLWRYRLYVLLSGRSKEDLLVTSKNEPREWSSLPRLVGFLTRCPYEIPTIHLSLFDLDVKDRNVELAMVD